MPAGADENQPAGGDSLAGQTIGGRYRIDEQLGEGAMGAVYRGTQLGLSRRIAVKVLHARHTDDPQVAKRFDREAIAISKLDHRNCVQVLDAGTTAERLKYIVMEYLEGQELRALLTEPLELPRAVALTSQILSGLEHAHRRGLVHRDLKPENVFVVHDDDDAEVAKLVDFGIVKLLDPETEEERLTRVGMVFGTPAYMAPEQAAGGKVDERTDLYAVGVLLHEMLSGEPPFQADEPGILLRMHMVADPPALPDDVPEPVRDVVGKLLAKAARDRYASAREARVALQEAVASKRERRRGGVVFLRALDDEPPPSSEASGVRHGTLVGSASLADGEVDPSSVAAGSAVRPKVEDGPKPAAERSGTMLAMPDESPSAARSQSSGLATIDPPSRGGVRLPPSRVFGTERALPKPEEASTPAPRQGGTGKVVGLAIALLVAAVVVVLAATGSFGCNATRSPVAGGA